MNFIVYGNEDSPVVPILLYEPGKVTYVNRVDGRERERESGGCRSFCTRERGEGGALGKAKIVILWFDKGER